MSEADFSGIDPVRVPEARRRVAALNAFSLSTTRRAPTLFVMPRASASAVSSSAG